MLTLEIKRLSSLSAANSGELVWHANYVDGEWRHKWVITVVPHRGC